MLRNCTVASITPDVVFEIHAELESKLGRDRIKMADLPDNRYLSDYIEIVCCLIIFLLSRQEALIRDFLGMQFE